MRINVRVLDLIMEVIDARFDGYNLLELDEPYFSNHRRARLHACFRLYTRTGTYLTHLTTQVKSRKLNPAKLKHHLREEIVKRVNAVEDIVITNQEGHIRVIPVDPYHILPLIEHIKGKPIRALQDLASWYK